MLRLILFEVYFKLFYNWSVLIVFYICLFSPQNELNILLLRFIVELKIELNSAYLI